MATTTRPAPPAASIGTVYVTTPYLARFEFRTRGLSLRTRQPHRSILAGRHASRVRGRGLDFAEIRAYLPGDDIRSVDWKASLRSGDLLVRTYTEERDHPMLFVVDQRMAMFFGSRRALKSVVAAELCALGAWIAFRGGDRVGAVVFNDSECHNIRPLRSRARLQQIFESVARLNNTLHAESPARANYAQLNRALEGALHLATHDHLVCVISDFVGADERTLQLLRELRAHNDVLGALVFDPLGQRLPAGGRLVATEGELQIEIDFGKRAVREPMAELFAQHLQRSADLLRRSGAPLLALNTEQDTLAQLRRQLGWVGARAAAGRSAP